MAMTLPIPISSTASPASSDDNSNQPRTPLSPTTTLPDQPAATSLPSNPSMKRKPSRRANTAERRATHNAVERQRRETLNGRFLDLAALLPNLSQIRRPSKSSIVNSSIAHIHASRRHRVLASRELRILKLESDSLRRELNEWRDRAALPRVEEPIRGEGFAMVLSGELEVLAGIPDDDEDCGGQGYDGYDDGEEEYNGLMGTQMDDLDDARNHHNVAAHMLKNPNPFAHNIPPNANGHLPHMISRSSHGPMIVSTPPTVSFENPAITSLYEPNPQPQFNNAPYLQQPILGQGDVDKVAAWNAQLYSALTNGSQQQQQQLMQAQRSLFTPPATSHGLPATGTATGSNGVTTTGETQTQFDPTTQAFFANFQRQPQQLAALPLGHVFGSPDTDDASSSEGSAHGHRERSGSLSGVSGSAGYASPHGSSPGSYELPNVPREYGVQPRRMSGGPSAWTHENMGSAIAVGGGGNGSGFAMMM